MKIMLIKLINLYQNTLSPDSGWFSKFYPGGYCKFHPNCSQYCKQSIEKYGAGKGTLRGVWRILRCNPWSSGGNDPT
jgi:hypothetical protein